MPRLSPKLLQHARRLDPLLPSLVRATRDLEAARNELRWLREHVITQAQSASARRRDSGWRRSLKSLCLARGRGRPLQYLLGTEYFGDLEIMCEPGVLIPRQETAASVTHLVQRLSSLEKLAAPLRVLDLCTGTGCIPLLFHHESRKQHPKAMGPRILGIDLSSKAITLARKNLNRQMEGVGSTFTSPTKIQFLQGDVFSGPDQYGHPTISTALDVLQKHARSKQKYQWDVLISNPPYISPKEFNQTTSRSVRNFEPKLALVPESQHQQPSMDLGDVFYPRLLDIANEVGAQVLLFEVADLQQAKRVASMVMQRRSWTNIEIWRDDPGSAHETDTTTLDGWVVPIVGSGNGRSVFAWRDGANEWVSRR